MKEEPDKYQQKNYKRLRYYHTQNKQFIKKQYRKRNITRTFTKKKLTSLTIHQEHIDDKRTIIVRRFQAINRLIK